MEITREQAQQMENIISEMQSAKPKCIKNYQCYRSNLHDLCKVKGIGTFDEIKCNAEENLCCGLSESHLGERFCNCPLRRYIAEHFRR